MGIGRTFQNLALFGQMSVLESILVGRHHLMRSNVVTGAFYWFGGVRREEIEHRAAAEEILQFLDIQHVRHARAALCRTACASAWNWRALSRSGPVSCCWTNRWPA